MSRLFLMLAATVYVLATSPSGAEAGFKLGAVFSDEGVESFHVAVGEFYGVPPKAVKAAKRGRIKDDDLPVVFFLAARARVPSATVVELRLKGLSWPEIMARYRLAPDILYVDVPHGPPYGKAWGFYGRPRKEWNRLKFADPDVVNLVNLRFISGHYGFPPAEVMKLRDKGEGFIAIHERAKKEKKEKGAKQEEKGRSGELKGGEKGGGEGKGKY